MSDDDKKALPKHLLAALGNELSERAQQSVNRVLDKRVEKLSTGRMSRALKLSRFAAKSASRAVVDRAKSALDSSAKGAVSVGLAAEMLETFSEMRGVTMKLGQMLSYLDDALPPEARRVLTVLQRDVSPMTWDVVEAALTESLGRDPKDVFASIEHEPIAAASIGQVHRATLPDGTAVAVKVQYPGIESAMAADLKNARMMSLFQRVMFFRTDTDAIMSELEQRFLDECNYEKEAHYQELYRERFKGHPWIVTPEVYTELSSRRVLVTKFYEGQTFYQWLEGDPSAEERDRVTKLFFRFYLGGFYMDGLFNCDPHPGNYLFMDDGRVVFLDYGCSRLYPADRRAKWVEMLNAVNEDDRDAMVRLAVEIGFVTESSQYDFESFRELMRYLYQPYLADRDFDFRDHPPRDTFRKMFVDNPNLFKLDMPADAVFLNRIGFGLVSLMTEIGAALNCLRYVRSYFEGIDPDWPEDPFAPGRETFVVDEAALNAAGTPA
ncbi:MAG: AarF/ABC1/UbiB kinase family protein [Deltaproteobacteria bacterium]|jgi:predicted unusual protein kinase regulating ubiquinone biosynthesis (AarF/ABC1/UbiB family)